MLQVGDQAPDFMGVTDAGATVTLRDFRGKKVVLYFYPRDDTPGCTREACAFRDQHQVLLDQGAVVLGVSTDGVDSHVRFREKYNLPFPLISDESQEIVNAYGVWKEKTLYGKTHMGTERTTFIIDERGVITHVFPKVKVDGHIQEVLAALSGVAPPAMRAVPPVSIALPLEMPAALPAPAPAAAESAPAAPELAPIVRSARAVKARKRKAKPAVRAVPRIARRKPRAAAKRKARPPKRARRVVGKPARPATRRKARGASGRRRPRARR